MYALDPILLSQVIRDCYCPMHSLDVRSTCRRNTRSVMQEHIVPSAVNSIANAVDQRRLL